MSQSPPPSPLDTSAPVAGLPRIVRGGRDRDGGDIRLFGVSPNRVKVSGADTGGRLALFAYEGHAPGGPPLHLHLDQDEVFVVEAGRYLFQVGDQRGVLSAGDTIFLPRGVPHGFAQLSAEGRLMFMFTPAGDMEAFFQAHARLDGGPDFAARAADLFAEHGMRIVGPPIDTEAPITA